GAYREWHFRPKTTKAVRIRFKMPNVTIDELELFGPAGQSTNFALARKGAQISSNADSGVDNRNPIDRISDGEYGTMTWRASFPKDGEERAWVRIEFAVPQEIARLRLSSNREYFYDTDYLDKKPWLPRYEFDLDILGEDGQWQPWIGTWQLNKNLNELNPERPGILAAVQRSVAKLAEEGPRPSFVGRFVPVVATHVLMRGSPESPRDEVVPAGPELLGGELGLDSDASGSARRAEFASWITSPENPLTARVMVNRIWHHVFGRGIVATTSDFGKAGAPPSHPELLDWLAAEFVEPTHAPGTKPWSMKSMIRMLVLSKAFRQDSTPRTDGLTMDAGSELLWRFPPKRVEAEVIRDSILLASGDLNPEVGGRSYRIHNEKKTYAQWEVLDNHGPETWRRMLYQERMRRVDDRMFTAFDFPDCGQVRAKRPVSTTPLQALNLMNSRFVMEQASRIAKRAQRETSDDQAVQRCFELILGRQPDDDERDACAELANEDLALICRALINSNEFAFLP
ncbi:MAG: DUF1553 domain-containing protein, partial [Planctomycetota bacterium]